MKKELELEFIGTEMKKVIDKLEQRENLNVQMIEELDKQLNIAKYGSVSHVTKVVRLSSLRNYKLRLTEIIDTFKQATDVKSLITFEGYINKVLEDSKTNLKVANESLNTVEVFSNDYIKNEILVKTYGDLVDLYEEALGVLTKLKEEAAKPSKEEGTKQPLPETPPVEGAIPKKVTPKKEIKSKPATTKSKATGEEKGGQS